MRSPKPFCCGLILCCVTSHAAEKLPPPEKADLAAAEEKTKAAFKDLFDKKTPEGQAALSETLLKTARDGGLSPAEKFYCLKAAATAATQAGDALAASTALDELGTQFTTDISALKLEAFTKLSTTLATPDAARALLGNINDAWQQALDADRFESSSKLLQLAQTLALKINDPATTAQLQEHSKQQMDLQREYLAVRPALLKLADKTDTPEDALTLGRYLALSKGNWDSGLPLLEKCSDAGLKKAALADHKATDATAAGAALDAEGIKAVLLAADAWWDSAERARVGWKDAELLRAANWYAKAQPVLTGLDKARVEKRVETLNFAEGASGGACPCARS